MYFPGNFRFLEIPSEDFFAYIKLLIADKKHEQISALVFSLNDTINNSTINLFN